MKGLQLLLKSFGLDMEPETLAMIQALIPQLPAKINEASAAINAALQNFDGRLQAIERQLEDLKTGPRLQAIENGVIELQEVLKNGHTGRASDAPGPGAGASAGDSVAGGAGAGRRRRGE